MSRRVPDPIRVSADSWVLAAGAWDSTHRGSYLGNGYLGQRFNPAGTGWSPKAAEPAHMAGLYEAHEALATLPSLTPLRIASGPRVYGDDPARLKGYRQELRLKEGTLVTRADWNTGTGEVGVELEAAVLRARPDTVLLRVRLDNRARQPVSVGIAPLKLDGWSGALEAGALRLSRKVGGREVRVTSLLRPLDRQDLTPAVGSAGWELPPGEKAEFALTTQVGGGAAEVNAVSAGRWLEDHRRAWRDLWAADIEIEGDPEAQQVVRACLFHLLCSVRPEARDGVPPMGISSQGFQGHVFWDMDSWMLPALLPQHPSLARAMLEYRFRTLEGARANARADKMPGASYAWESAATGRETLTGDFRHGRHVSGCVALALKQYYQATGDREWLRSRGWPILKATADYWVARATPGKGGGFVINRVTTPDESAGVVDHSAWTQHVAAVNLRFAGEAARILGQPANPKWDRVARGLTFLRNSDGLIRAHSAFDEKKKSKQADALLLLFPGEASPSGAETGRMYDFYRPRVIANGPAMTDAIHAVVAARLGRTPEAVERFRDSYRPFVRPPFHLFSEKRTRDNVCFLTGAAGVVEAVLYGFAGLHLEPDPARPDRPRLEPHLPAEWKSLRLRGLRWRGRLWDVLLTPGATPRWEARG